MSERVPAQNKTSATPSQATQASSPLLHRHGLTDEHSESVGNNSNISQELGGIQPKTIRRSLNWQNITVEAPSRGNGMSLPGGIQRQQEELPAVIGDRVEADSVQKSPLESSNSTISTDLPAHKPLIARAPFNGRNIPVEAPSRIAERSLPSGIQRSEVAAIAPNAAVKVPDGLREQAPGGANYVDIEGVEKKTILMYEKIAAMTDDVAKIAKNTGIPEHYIAKVKEHLFIKEHELEISNQETREVRRVKGRFTPFEDIADSWMLAINKSMQVDELFKEFEVFKQLIAHEYIEARLMDDGLPYRNPNSWREHPIYGWGNYPAPGDKGYGAHNLSCNPNPNRSNFGHWKQECDKSPEGLSLAKDISNLDELVEKIKEIIKE